MPIKSQCFCTILKRHFPTKLSPFGCLQSANRPLPQAVALHPTSYRELRIILAMTLCLTSSVRVGIRRSRENFQSECICLTIQKFPYHHHCYKSRMGTFKSRLWMPRLLSEYLFWWERKYRSGGRRANTAKWTACTVEDWSNQTLIWYRILDGYEQSAARNKSRQ